MKPNGSIFIITLFLSQTSFSEACTPRPQQSNPPKLINGEWIQPAVPSKADRDNADIKALLKMNYDFIFSGVYSKEVSFADAQLSFIETQHVWQGNVPKSIDLKVADRPSNPDCKKLKFDQEYIFFGTLGNRSQPLLVKEFRLKSKALQQQLGPSKKRWLRGRLIETSK